MTTVVDVVEIHVTALQDRNGDHLRNAMHEIVTHLSARGVLRMTPHNLCVSAKQLLANDTFFCMGPDDKLQSIRILNTSLWCGGWLPSGSTAAAFRYPLLPLDMSADAPPFSTQLPPGSGRLYLSMTECERGDALVAGECGGGTVAVNIPLVGVTRIIPFEKNLTTDEVISLCHDSYSKVRWCLLFKFAIVGLTQQSEDSKDSRFWTGNVSVNAEPHCADCNLTFDVRRAPDVVDDPFADDIIACISCDTELSCVLVLLLLWNPAYFL